MFFFLTLQSYVVDNTSEMTVFEMSLSSEGDWSATKSLTGTSFRPNPGSGSTVFEQELIFNGWNSIESSLSLRGFMPLNKV